MKMEEKCESKLTISLANLRIDKSTLDQLVKVYITKRINRQLMVKPLKPITKKESRCYITKKSDPGAKIHASTSVFRKINSNLIKMDRNNDEKTININTKPKFQNLKLTKTKNVGTEPNADSRPITKGTGRRDTQVETELLNIVGNTVSKHYLKPKKLVTVSVNTDELERIFDSISLQDLAKQFGGNTGIHPFQIWMNQPLPQADCPLGLEYLSDLDRIQIHKIRYKEGMLTRTYFMAENEIGQYVYRIDVHLKCIYKFLCVACKRFELSISDADQYEIMHFSRLSVVGANRSVDIFAPINTYLGKIYEQDGNPPFYVILDPENEVLYKIFMESGPPNSEYTFSIISVDGNNYIGKIVQEYSYLMKKVYHHTEYLSIYYFTKVDPKIKALILGASFLLGFIYFESLYINI